MRAAPVLLIASALIAAACSGDDSTSTTATPVSVEAPPTSVVAGPSTTSGASTPDPSTAPTEPAGVGTAEFDVVAGTEQLTVTGADADRAMIVYDADDTELIVGLTDANGALVVRDLPGGAAFTIGSGGKRSAPVTTLTRDEHPDQLTYELQTVESGDLTYLVTRDGTTLSANVWLPGPVADGPFPTVVEYSGYSPSNPDATGYPDIFTALGYAYVGVNMRGTGCSGGSFDYFEYSQSLDGYDAIETIAAQPWVQGNRVGMVGVSYPGISQLFVARTRPPSLAAITPFSVLADSAISTLYPGGILNTGFAVPWAEERMSEAEPEGQQWAADRIADGDVRCAENQLLRLQNPDLLAEIESNPFWTDDIAGEIAPRLFVDEITVPTFVAGAWQDEQTGGHFATMLDQFTGTDHFYATLVNGLHTESIAPSVLPRLVEFLDLYVGERTPSLDVARSIAPQLGASIFGTTEVALPPDDRFDGMTHAEALEVFESESPIQILFEEGAADGFPARSPMARWEASFDSWPIPDAAATAWQLGGSGVPGEPGSLGPADATAASETGYLALPDAVPPTFFGGASSIWSVDVEYDWVEGGLGTFASFVSEPLAEDTVVIGSGSVDLWITSNLGDTDLEVTISEVRPDGQEMYVQSGWLRASQRALDESVSTELRPVHTHREADAANLPAETFEPLRVELFPFAHPFRAGSQIRLVVDAPGGNRAEWEFATIAGGEKVTIAHSPLSPSRLVLPVVSGLDVPDPLPECGSLRGQPCREYRGD